MSRPETQTNEYSVLGLLANPLGGVVASADEPTGIQLASQAAAFRLLTALHRASGDPEHRPVFVRKADIPASYHVKALARCLADLGSDVHGQHLFSIYVPLDMMKMGRVRAVLSATAERVAGLQPELTLGLWTQKVLREPDMQLVEWGFLADIADVDALKREFDEDPAKAAERVFGSPLEGREGAEDMEMVMRVSFSRQDLLDTDPAEGEEGLSESENPTDDPLLEVFATPLVQDEQPALGEAEQEEAPDPAELLADYVVAHTKANLSPVVARAIRAYIAQGSAPMAQELKISKAPTKTLVALLEFLSVRYRSAVVLFDRLEMWHAMPQDLRLKIVNTFTSMRWAIKDFGTLCFTAVAGAAPEVEEAFAAAAPVEWDFSELPKVSSTDAVYDAAVVRGWIASASSSGTAPDWADEVLAAVPDGVTLAVAAAALREIIDEAAANARIPAAADVATALERVQEDTAT